MKNERKSMADIRHKVVQKPRETYPVSLQKPVRQIDSLTRKVGANMDIARSKTISHFAKNATISPTQAKPTVKPIFNNKPTDIKHASHPLTKNIQAHPVTNIPATAKSIKDAAIAEVFQKISDRRNKEKEAEKKRSRKVLIITTIIAILGICAYFLYISLPAISVGIANAKSGIEASYPNYCPEGYSRNGLANYTDGEVVIDYRSNNNSNSFSVKQAKSTWDSSAVKSMVNEASVGKFITTEESGLTIFSYDGNATWVNGGILYKISSSAPLAIADIRQIALSL